MNLLDANKSQDAYHNLIIISIDECCTHGGNEIFAESILTEQKLDDSDCKCLINCQLEPKIFTTFYIFAKPFINT